MHGPFFQKPPGSVMIGFFIEYAGLISVPGGKQGNYSKKMYLTNS